MIYYKLLKQPYLVLSVIMDILIPCRLILYMQMIKYISTVQNGHKIDAINKCNKVSLCVVDKDDVVEEELTTYFKSVILFGKASILNTDKEIFHAAKFWFEV